MFIPGLCRIYARKTAEPHWFKLSYAPRSYSECERLIDYYQETWGQFYDYVITADHDLCAPKSVYIGPKPLSEHLAWLETAPAA